MSATLNKILDAFDQYEAMRLVGKGLEWKWSAEAEEKFLRLGREHQALMTMENIFKIAEEVTHTQTALLNNAKDILRYRHLGLAYLKMLHVSDPIAAINKDVRDPSMFIDFLIGPKVDPNPEDVE
jgi:hypothetical protein